MPRSAWSSPARSSRVREAVGVLCLILLFSLWSLVTLFPDGGLGSLGQTAVRGVVAGAGCVVLALGLSWPLKSAGFLEWAPLFDLYRRRRVLRARRLYEIEVQRGERKQAPYRAIEALPPAAEQG